MKLAIRIKISKRGIKTRLRLIMILFISLRSTVN